MPGLWLLFGFRMEELDKIWGRGAAPGVLRGYSEPCGAGVETGSAACKASTFPAVRFSRPRRKIFWITQSCLELM